jgi:hypothetical protein
LLLDGCPQRSNLRNFGLFIVFETRMDQGDYPQEEKYNPQDYDEAFHAEYAITNLSWRERIATGHTTAPVGARDVQFRGKNVLRMSGGSCSGGFLGGLGSS